ncbi:MAG: hypothetical protein LBL31_04630 [Spirochaetaceae bacterium]|jgi:hypothetical protein|nr:hypothetical protein [Spirochaetaceae bacterium]
MVETVSAVPDGVIIMGVVTKPGVFIFIAAALLFPAGLTAEENEPSDLLRYYDSELFQWNYSMSGGLTLNFQNQNASPIYGIRAPMKEALLRYPDSAKEYKAYRWKNTAGNILFWGGFAGTVGVFCVSAFFNEDVWIRGSPSLKIAAGVVLAGFLAEMTGVLLMSASQEDIYSAVNEYNRNRIGEYK